MDFALEQLNINKTSALRDSVSTILSAQGSIASSTGTTLLDTPGSSPASSVVFLSRQSSDHSTSTPFAPTGKSRASSFASSTTLHSSKRYSSLPVPGSSGLARKTPLTRSSVVDLKVGVSSRLYSSPTPARSLSRQEVPVDDKPSRPRWNASTNLKDTPLGHNFKPISMSTPSPYKKSLQMRSPRAVSTPSVTSQPSPLARQFSASTTSSVASRPPCTPLGGRVPRPASSLARPPTSTPASRIPRASVYFTPGTAPRIPSSPTSSLRSTANSVISDGSAASSSTITR